MDQDKVHGSMEIQLLTSHALLFKFKLARTFTHTFRLSLTHTITRNLTLSYTYTHKHTFSHTKTHKHTYKLTLSLLLSLTITQSQSHKNLLSLSHTPIHTLKHTHARVWVPEVSCKSICVSYQNDLKIANHPPIKKGSIDQINKKQKYIFFFFVSHL